MNDEMKEAFNAVYMDLGGRGERGELLFIIPEHLSKNFFKILKICFFFTNSLHNNKKIIHLLGFYDKALPDDFFRRDSNVNGHGPFSRY
jgi:hypothetical protein